MTRIREVFISVGRIVVDVAPVVAMLGRGSSPIAWAAAGVFLAKQIHTEWMQARHRGWLEMSWQQAHAILELARSSSIGVVVARYEAGEERTIGGTLYGAGPTWYTGPFGDEAPIVDALWQAHEALAVLRTGDETLSLVGDRRRTEPPSRLVESIAEECVALHRSGAGVGLLIDGPPGTGKSQALLHVAAALGGRTLRATLKSANPSDVVSLAKALRATAVVLDDIDRGPTDGALDAVEQLVACGVAVLASSNDSAEICGALLRDGRIDDHRTFGAVEPDVLERLAVGLEPEVVQRLRACTVASVARYVERRAAWGPERALAQLKPLVDAPAVDEPGPAA